MCGDCFDPLSDRSSYERCEGVGKTAVRCACGLWYRQSRVGEVVSRLFRAAGNMEKGFSDPFLLTL